MNPRLTNTRDARDIRKRVPSAITAAQLLELGKLPPQAIELEEAVLGAMMLDKNALTNVIGTLAPEVFYKEAHQYIFKAFRQLFDRAEPVDILSVTQELKKSGELEIAGGAFYVTQITNRIASAANLEYHSRIVLQKFLQRELIRVSTETIRDGYEDTTDVFEMIDKAEQNFFKLNQTYIKRNFEDIRNLLGKAIKEIEASRDQKLSGVQTGFSRMDAITGGWQKSDLIIVAARPGMGKTGFVISIARNAAVDFQRPVAIFSLEMASTQLVTRLIASEAEIPSDKLRKGDLKDHEFHQINAKIGKLTTAPFFIDDTPALSVFEFRAKARRLVAQHNVSLIIVDYLQLMNSGMEGRAFSREQEVSRISSALKTTAKELNIPIIACSQLSRATEQRGDRRRPMLSDLRESGAIEQDADIVIFLYRPEYYQITEDENGNPTQGMAEVIIAKHRNGKTGTETLRFISEFAKFEEPSSFAPIMGEEQQGSITYQSKMNSDDNAIEEDL